MNEYIANIENKKYSIKSDDFKTVLLNEESVKVQIDRISEYVYKLNLGNKIYTITTSKITNEKRAFLINGHYFEGSIRTSLEEMANELSKSLSAEKNDKSVKSPMPGLILKINKNVGDVVKAGDSLLLLEAMKMENDLKASTSGIVKEILVSVGDSVEKNETLIIID